MATRKTLELLPSIFQTDTNRKFLSATLDQLVSEPEFVRLNGYIGRKFAPTYKTTDNYIREIDSLRQNYQLEPSVVIKDADKNIEFYSGYTDLLNKIQYYGGLINNHDRLFNSDYYTYDGLFDHDKFVNFSQYYWLPNGPTPIKINNQVAAVQGTINVERSINDAAYFVNNGVNRNDDIVLVRGGNYRFAINQPGTKFYLQTEPGTTGKKKSTPSLSTRNIFGVSNNGIDSGFIDFQVPLADRQDVYLKMPLLNPIDFVVDIPFSDIDGKTWQQIVNNYGGFDGIDFFPEDKEIIFINVDNSPQNWITSDFNFVPLHLRTGIFYIKNVNGTVKLEYARDLPVDHRVYARLGFTRAYKEYYLNQFDTIVEVPGLTAQLDVLYYQDQNNPQMFGRILLVDDVLDPINVDDNIIGKTNYQTRSGVNLSNGMIVEFDNNTLPSKYAGNKYIVEGVGQAIKLINFAELVFPETNLTTSTVAWDTENFDSDGYDKPILGPADPDYITINRSSQDRNPWSRQNRWFHIDVITKSSEVNNLTLSLNQALRARRPIIEFEPDLQLFKFGRIGKPAVDFIDTDTPDAFNQIQHNSQLQIGNQKLRVGQRVLFANDHDPLVRSQIYTVDYQLMTEPSYKDLYDQVGIGTISIEAPKIGFTTTTKPVLSIQAPTEFVYTWLVNSDKIEMLNAQLIEGLFLNGSNQVAVINNVSASTNNNYTLTFTVSRAIGVISLQNIRIRGPGGSNVVRGQGTNFLNDIEPGSILATENNQILGRVLSVFDNDSLVLESNAEISVVNSKYKYKEPKIRLIVSDDPRDSLEQHDVLVALDGNNKGISYYFDGSIWNKAQIKADINQAPQFDIFDENDRSFGNYSGSNFIGCKIFSYKPGSGIPDQILGFPLTYSTAFGGAGNLLSEITFENNYVIDTFNYFVDKKPIQLSVDHGYIRQNTNRNDFRKRNIYSKATEPTKQYQIISNIFNGTSNYFEIDILPDSTVNSSNIKIFLNNRLLRNVDYEIATVGVRRAVRINSALLTAGDKIDILIYSKHSTSLSGYYQIPVNLDLNSKNESVPTLTIGQLRNNLISISQNIPNISGEVPGSNNLRDLDYKKYSGNLIKNSSPLIYSNLFLIHEQANLINSVEYARKEYTKFKNKFLELCVSLNGIDIHDPKTGVDKILASMNQVKNVNFPWYYSDMVPYGEADITVYKVLVPRQRQYRIKNIFVDNQVQSRAVLVYHNGLQLIKGYDYKFDYTKPVIILADHIVTNLNDQIEIRDYASTDGNFIPETPSKLGLYPKYLPEIYFDNTFRVVNSSPDTSAYFTVNDGQSLRNFIIRLDDPVKISQARDQIAGRSPKKHITGIIITRPVDYNPNYSFHYDPDTIEFFESATEVCDSTFNYVEDHLDEVGGAFLPGGRLCPFLSALLLEVTPELEPQGVEMLRGHDGSLVPVFNDHRDQFLLELERRIYNNIKIDHEKSTIDIRKYIPGAFRDNGYTRIEFDNIIGGQFLKWVGANKVDYIANPWFQSSDTFSYNYRNSLDLLFNQSLPGYWRGIYRYFYDTEHPHMTPWEMLGLSEKPSWWEEEYGLPPYTSGNSILWNDLEQGIIRKGINAGIYPEYARPGLTKIIPVDNRGNLKSPLQVLATGFNTSTGSQSYAVGDCGPVEAAWKHSSEYPYALQIAVALMKPSVYFGLLMDLENYYQNKNYNQFLYSGTRNSITPTDIKVNGLIKNGSVIRSRGYLNWITDYITGLGINGSTKVRHLLDNIEVQLSYKIAGFTDKKYLTILAEQYSPTSVNDSVVIPDDNYTVYLNKSVPVERIVYSAVIIEKTGAGYAVSGYNTNNPYFTIVPSETSGSNYTITVEKISATIYQHYRKEKLIIPYGTTFRTRQQIVDFLVSYQRFLYSQGFVFDEFNSDLRQNQDWILSCKEFLTWTLQGWKDGSIIVLSPTNTKLKLLSFNSVVDKIVNDVSGSKLLDPNFSIIRHNEITLVREDNRFIANSISGKTFALADLNLIQYEHVLIFDNSTVFNDILYSPNSGNRQYRLRLVGSKTGNWNGSLSIPGFIFNNQSVEFWVSGKDYRKGDLVEYKNQYYVAIQNASGDVEFNLNTFKQVEKDSIKYGLLTNFSHNAVKFENIYDTESAILDENMFAMSSGLIGYRSRDYLTDLTINSNSQLKFYQGYIKDKGTISAAKNLSSAVFSNLKNLVTINEEWAFRIGEYGATNSTAFVEIELDESLAGYNPAGIHLLGNDTEPVEGMINVSMEDIYDRSGLENSVRFLNRPDGSSVESDLETAGYVNVDDVDVLMFNYTDSQSIADSLADIGSGSLVWIAKDSNDSWNVYRVTETETSIEQIAYGLDNTAIVTTKEKHRLGVDQKIIIKNLNDNVDGLYFIKAVLSETEFSIQISDLLIPILKLNPIVGRGILFQLNTVKFSEPSEIANFTPPHGWKDNDLVWVDKDESNYWAVLQKNNPWEYQETINPFSYQLRKYSNFGTSVKLSHDQQYLVVGSPGDGYGRINVYSNDGSNTERVYRPLLSDVTSLGFSVDINDEYVYAGAPNSYNGQGAVAIFKSYRSEVGPFFTISQLIELPFVAESQFGYSITASADAKHLYIGSPGNSFVYYYNLIEFENRTDYFDMLSSITGITLPYTINDPLSIAVYIKGNFALYNKDYTIDVSTGKIRFSDTNAPTLSAESDEGFAFAAESSFVQPGLITVVQRSYYKQVQAIGTGLERLGHSIKTSNDGSILIIGAPEATVNDYLYAGRIYVYKNTFQGIQPLSFIQQINNPNPVYKAKFGNSVEITNDKCNIFVGAPGYSESLYKGGMVYRFVDGARLFGTATSIVNPLLFEDESIIINGIEVYTTGSTLTSFKNNIDAANISGVTANIVDNKLVLTSSVTDNFNKLIIEPGRGSLFNRLNFNTIIINQTIQKPLNTDNDNFGEVLSLSVSNNILGISSTTGTGKNFNTIDAGKTTFDGGTTIYIDVTPGSGAVYLYERVNNNKLSLNSQGSFIIGSTFNAPKIMLGDKFGSSIAIGDQFMVIGASSDDSQGLEVGNVHKYNNVNKERFWKKHRQQSGTVDIHSINSVSIYNRETKEKLATLDYIDPNKNKCLGYAEENIDIKSSFDPAAYNAGSQYSSENIDFHWGPAQIGKTWLNLGTLKFIDYEQGTLIYRLSNWGKIFPGSQIEVYEWVESEVLPSQYQDSGFEGTPLHIDDSAYVSIGYADSGSGLITNKYYYWVRGISSVNPNLTRKVSVLGIESAIENPRAQGIPYAAFLSNSSIALYNCDSIIKNTKAILKIDYDIKINSNLIHAEYDLVTENSAEGLIPPRIINKLIDSLSGIDKNLRIVPDPNLKSSQRYGLELRPRQTLVKYRYEALRNLVIYVNEVLSKELVSHKIQNVDLFVNSFLFAKNDYPAASEYDERVKNTEELSYVNRAVNKRILVERDADYNNIWTLYLVTDSLKLRLIKNQHYNTNDLWQFKNWYANGYNPNSAITYDLEFFNEIQKYAPGAGEIVRVNSAISGGKEIYRFNDQLQPELVGVENGTISINSNTYNMDNDIGYDNNLYEGDTYDKTYGIELRNLLNGLLENIFTDDLLIYKNKLMFVLIKYILSEQGNIDWTFKTSFINIVHKLKELGQYPNYSKDNHNYYESYINEIKPYKSKLREYKIAYTNLDTVNASISDFDLPGYWDADLGRFRSPSGEYKTKDNQLYLTESNIDWYTNNKFTIDTVIITDRGNGYTAPPQVKIIADGDGGEGATAIAVINEITGKLQNILVTNPGKNYTKTPIVVINGNGFGARAYAQLSNSKIRSIKTVLKFDRVAYQSEVKEWLPNKSYSIGDMVGYKGQGYRAVQSHNSSVFSLDNFHPVDDAAYETANDRLSAVYYPGPNQIPREFDQNGNVALSRLITGLNDQFNILSSDNSVYNESIVAAPAIDITTDPEDINFAGGVYYDVTKSFAPEELVPGRLLDSVKIMVETEINNLKYRYNILRLVDQTKYYVVPANNTTSLVKPLRYSDEFIYVGDVSKITAPDVPNRIPGRVVINGEIIHFWYYNTIENTIADPIRGIDGTAIPEQHEINTIVTDQNESFRIPGATTKKISTFTFNKENPIFTTSFSILPQIEFLSRSLSVYNGITKLELDKDYTLTIVDSLTGYKAVIEFVNADKYPDGMSFKAEYLEDRIWLNIISNPNPSQITDGTGLAGSNHLSAVFVKQFPHN